MNQSPRCRLAWPSWMVGCTLLAGLCGLAGCLGSSEVGSIDLSKSKSLAAEKGIGPGHSPDRTPPKRTRRPDPAAPKFGPGNPAGKAEAR